MNSLSEDNNTRECDTAIADKSVQYLKKFSKSHALNIGDAIIAATASKMELSLVTKECEALSDEGYFGFEAVLKPVDHSKSIGR